MNNFIVKSVKYAHGRGASQSLGNKDIDEGDKNKTDVVAEDEVDTEDETDVVVADEADREEDEVDCYPGDLVVGEEVGRM